MLVVDNNVDAAETLARILELWGHQPSVAHDVQRALELLSAEQPGGGSTDIGLPGFSTII